jgi:hypothetical protein
MFLRHYLAFFSQSAMKTLNSCKIAMTMKLWWYIQFLTLINAHYSNFEKNNSGGCVKFFSPTPPRNWRVDIDF